MSVLPNGRTLGVTKYRHATAPSPLTVQVHLGGPAAEDILTGRRRRELDREIGCALLVRGNPSVAEVFADEAGRDAWLAVRDFLHGRPQGSTEVVVREMNVLYDVAKQSLLAVWPTVAGLAKALLRHGELDQGGIDRWVRGDIYTPVFEVQAAHGIMTT